jgi:hypothetical protein
MRENPFDSIESAYQYLNLLRQQVCEVREHLFEDVVLGEGETRRVDAVRLVDYKLTQLADHLAVGARILNDLRALRRLLLADRDESAQAVRDSGQATSSTPKASAPRST